MADPERLSSLRPRVEEGVPIEGAAKASLQLAASTVRTPEAGWKGHLRPSYGHLV